MHFSSPVFSSISSLIIVNAKRDTREKIKQQNFVGFLGTPVLSGHNGAKSMRTWHIMAVYPFHCWCIRRHRAANVKKCHCDAVPLRLERFWQAQNEFWQVLQVPLRSDQLEPTQCLSSTVRTATKMLRRNDTLRLRGGVCQCTSTGSACKEGPESDSSSSTGTRLWTAFKTMKHNENTNIADIDIGPIECGAFHWGR